MKTIEPKILKGFRDFLPQEAKKRQYVINLLKKVFESYGFEPLETPALEYEEILLGKYGDEGDKLMYRFTDRGGRKVALRYDQTVPLARVVAQYQNEFPMPFKRYQIQNVWRADNTQKGRFREFLQCDADIVGSSSSLADSEIISLAERSLEKLGFKNFTTLVNSRTVLKNSKASLNFIKALDKQDKLSKDEFLRLLSIAKESDKEAYEYLKNSKPEDDSSLREIFNNKNLNLFYMPTLARGLDYYTGIIFELKIDGYSAGSVCGGGRYDNLIGLFANKQIPAVGFAFGFDRLIEAMEELNLFPGNLTATKVLVTIFSEELKEKSLETASFLRSKGINTELYIDGSANLEKQLKYADKKGIPFAIVIGPDEVKDNTITLRSMMTREQKSLPISEAIKNFKVNT
ncbi:MAG: histidine--tRNA ligase [Candidatus Levybacteria bacterium]|nr:histidine--tRNA ligase [Candidatus Levybacteria bacterium]